MIILLKVVSKKMLHNISGILAKSQIGRAVELRFMVIGSNFIEYRNSPGVFKQLK